MNKLAIPWTNELCVSCEGTGYRPRPGNMFAECEVCDGARHLVLCRSCRKYVPASDPVVCDYGVCFRCRHQLESDVWEETGDLLVALEKGSERVSELADSLRRKRNLIQGV